MDRERQLIDSVLAGNLRDFQTLVENYQRLVTHIVFRMVTNETDREEICQDVFIKVYSEFKKFQVSIKTIYLDWKDCSQYLHQLS